MLRILWRMARGYRLRPWRSPYLRWRIETYSGIHADGIAFMQFWRFVWTNRRPLLRYLHWARGEYHRFVRSAQPPKRADKHRFPTSSEAVASLNPPESPAP
jgi:hypothetical protein